MVKLSDTAAAISMISLALAGLFFLQGFFDFNTFAPLN
jgi:hypothetical protein